MLWYRGYCGIANTRYSIIRLLVVHRRWSGRARECRDWPARQTGPGAGGAKSSLAYITGVTGRYARYTGSRVKKRVAQEGRLGA